MKKPTTDLGWKRVEPKLRKHIRWLAVRRKEEERAAEDATKHDERRRRVQRLYDRLELDSNYVPHFKSSTQLFFSVNSIRPLWEQDETMISRTDLVTDRQNTYDTLSTVLFTKLCDVRCRALILAPSSNLGHITSMQKTRF